MAIIKHRVGIFSRDGEDNYMWLVSLLRRPMFRGVLEDVLTVYISDTSTAFESALSKCTFAILYHTKNRGRLNITNVTDSLYDQQLELLSTHLGRENVVVLLDDLQDSDESIRRNLLQHQPLIDTCACQLILVSELEKSSGFNGRNVSWDHASSSRRLQGDMLHKKMRNLLDIMSQSLKHTPGYSPPSSPSDPGTDPGRDSPLLPPSDPGPNPGYTPPPSPYDPGTNPGQYRPLSTSDPGPDPGVKEGGKEKTGSKKTGNKSFFEFSKISPTNVLWIIAGLIVILLIVLILILCLTL